MKPQDKIAKLQSILREKNIDTWIIPSADPHQSEYVAEHWQTQAWISGFHGSAGTVIVTQEKSGLWTDPRYHIRAAKELAGSGIELFPVGQPNVPTYFQWLQQTLKPGSTIGFDGRLFSVADAAKLKEMLNGSITFSYEDDLTDQIWNDRPALPTNPIRLQDLKFSGQSRQSKFQQIHQKLKQLDCQAFLITTLDEIAWLFNIRGSDIQFNPVAYAYAIISEADTLLFLDQKKVTDIVRQALVHDSIRLLAYEALNTYWQTLPAKTTILIDPTKTGFKLEQAISQHCQVRHGVSPVNKAKAIKNETELDSLRKAHIRDGVALVRWMYWLDQQPFKNNVHTEITLANKLTKYRALGDHYQGLSFGTILGYESNSAVGHYSPHPDTTPIIRPYGILLIDSGGQYLDGTTDITRTITLGSPTPKQKRVATSVLKSLIRLTTAIFPRGTTGHTLDALAREPLWQEGWNCRHGIGHGIGVYLNVHEGPQRLAPGNQVPFVAGMTITIEPGIYFEGEFGIRLENVVITRREKSSPFGEFLGFETVTFCPFDLDLIDPTLLNTEEKTWINDYHQSVYSLLSPLLSDSERNWLQRETRPI